MAAKGILSKPPSNGSPGKRPAKPVNKGANKRGDKTPNAGLPNLTRKQNQVLGQTQDQDLSIGKMAGGLLGGVQNAYSQPFDYEKYQNMMPGQGDFNAWQQSQVDAGNRAFDERNNPYFAQQKEDFEQQMANRGIPMGSEQYNREKTRLEQSQNDARIQAFNQNYQNAATNAQRFFDMGNQTEQNQFNMAQTARNAPITEYATIKGLQTGQQNQNLQYSQQQAMQDAQNAAQIKAAQIQASAMGKANQLAPTEWQRAGFKSYKDFAEYNSALAQNQYNNTIGANQPKSGNPYAGAVGTAIGIGTGILANHIWG